ncbi:hypothetical protein [Humibacter sp. RRB41]|uniref:hypothetical protein n=1 Tax=Humibacter sp. RRB41 TaxID=2919946 RepID=UPI001FAB0D6B|nr:hypothetical protein [Humibacter sp. RRB41]
MTPSSKPAGKKSTSSTEGSRPKRTGSPRWLINTIAIVAAAVIIIGIIATIAVGGRLF